MEWNRDVAMSLNLVLGVNVKHESDIDSLNKKWEFPYAVISDHSSHIAVMSVTAEEKLILEALRGSFKFNSVEMTDFSFDENEEIESVIIKLKGEK